MREHEVNRVYTRSNSVASEELAQASFVLEVGAQAQRSGGELDALAELHGAALSPPVAVPELLALHRAQFGEALLARLGRLADGSLGGFSYAAHGPEESLPLAKTVTVFTIDEFPTSVVLQKWLSPSERTSKLVSWVKDVRLADRLFERLPEKEFAADFRPMLAIVAYLGWHGGRPPFQWAGRGANGHSYAVHYGCHCSANREAIVEVFEQDGYTVYTAEETLAIAEAFADESPHSWNGYRPKEGTVVDRAEQLLSPIPPEARDESLVQLALRSRDFDVGWNWLLYLGEAYRTSEKLRRRMQRAGLNNEDVAKWNLQLERIAGLSQHDDLFPPLALVLDALTFEDKPMSLEAQIADLTLIVPFRSGVSIDELLRWGARSEYEERPFELLLKNVGARREGTSRFISDHAWTMDHELRSYASIAKQLCRIADQPHRIHKVQRHRIQATGEHTVTFWAGDQFFRCSEVYEDSLDPWVVWQMMKVLHTHERDFYKKENGNTTTFFYLNWRELSQLNDLVGGSIQGIGWRSLATTNE